MSDRSHSITSYCVNWEKEFPFIKPCSADKYSAMCTYCSKSFKIDKSGAAQIKLHEKGVKHQKAVSIFQKSAGNKKQSQLVMGKDTQLTATSMFSPEYKVTKAETLIALKFVESNYSFASATEDSELYKEIFPDSLIAKNYQMGETKVKYVIQHGISPYVSECKVNDLQNVPYTFKFDETTTSQVKKQYDAYIQYWSPSENRIISIYCTSLFVGHCNSDDLIDHFFEVITKMKTTPQLLLHIGMDGPNVNQAFQGRLRQELVDKHQTSIIDVGTCTLHKVHNAFRKGIEEMDFDIDVFVTDVSAFFKQSAARREDYLMMQTFTDLEPHFAVKHVTSRWLSLRKACLRILEQYSNLKQYFTVFIPLQANFKREVKNTNRYQRIVKILNDDLSQVFLSFLAFAASEFETYVRVLQTNKPMIHHLYDRMVSLVYGIAKNFMKESWITKTSDDGSRKPLSGNDFSSLDFTTHHKRVDKIDIGTRAMSFLVQLSVPAETRKLVQERCLKFYVRAVTQLQSTLPLSNRIIKSAQFISPQKRLQKGSLVGVSRLALNILPSLSNDVQQIFNVPSGTAIEDICDMIRCQWQDYQTAAIPSEWFEETAAAVSSYQQKSYWKNLENDWCTIDDDNIDFEKPIDAYWQLVFDLKENGRLRFPQLSALIKCVLSISHGNAGPEHGFSLNKAILQSHGTSLNEDTLIALRNVKDELIRVGGKMKFAITDTLIRSVRASRRRYHADLDAKRKLSEAESEVSNQPVAMKSNEVCQIDGEICRLEQAMEVAENIIVEGNQKLQTAMRAIPLSTQKIQMASSQIEMGMDRKRKLAEDIVQLKKRRSDLL